MEAENENILFSKLGKCQQCNRVEAKYNCPQCEIKTCCLNCVNQHKKERECSGVRIKTAYKSLSEFTDLDLLSDYRLLEEAGRSVDLYYRDKIKEHTRINRELPGHLLRLRTVAAKKGTQIRFLPPNFTRHQTNSTFLDEQTQKIEWTIQWKFDWLNSPITDERVPEDLVLKNALEPHIMMNADNLHVFLPVEHIHGQSGRFYPIDMSKTIEANLKGASIIEYPIFHVVVDPKDSYPLFGSKTYVVKHQDGPPEKKSKMSFFEVSDGESSEAEDTIVK